MSRSARILIVDDDAGTCETLSDVLQARGHDVHTASSGREGLSLLSVNPVDVAIVDIKLPDIPGLELLAAIKGASPQTEVIFVTAYASISTAIQAINGAAFAYITKPFEMEHLLATMHNAHEKQGLVRALRESEQRYRLVTEHIRDAIFLVDLENRFTFGNRRIADLTGYRLDELVGRPISLVLASEGAGGDAARLDGPDGPTLYETELVRKDGTKLSVEIDSTNVVQDGVVVARLVVGRDITKRKRDEAALRESEERFRATFEQAAAGIGHTSLDGRWVRVNQRLCDIVGYERDELLARSFEDITHPDDVDVDRSLRRRLLANDIQTVSRETRYLRKDASPVWVDVTLSILRDPAGEPQYVISVVQDITGRKQLEQELLHAQETLLKQAGRLRILHDIDIAIITETAPVAIAEAVLLRLRDLLGVPRAIVNLFDLAAGEVEWLAAVGRRRIHRGPGVRYSIRLAGDLDALRRGEPQLIDVETLPPSSETDALLAAGVRVYMVVPMVAGGELIGSVSLGGDQARFSEAQVDIAREVATQLAIALRQARLVEKLKAAYEDLQRAQAQLAQSQKMEAIGQLAGGIAHDFNNLLTVIGGRSSLLLLKMERNDPARKDIDLIQSTAERAAGLTRQLLAFSRKQVLEPKPVDVDALVAGVAPMLKRLIGEHIEIVIVPGRSLGHVMADRGQMEQVIMNLAVNARDAMPDGGTLTIETDARTVPDSDPQAAGRHVPPGQYVTLTIRDSGCGMDLSTQARIFEPFFTTKEPGKGTGLGLSTVHGIVHQSGGNLSVDSAVGRGTTFTIYLPRIPDQGDASPSAEEAPLDIVEGSGTVLLVEDDEDLRELTSEILRVAGYTVVEAGGPLAALTLSEKRRWAIDLLLTDMVMPVMRGPELAGRVRSSCPGLKVLFMSGYTADTGGAALAGEPAAFLQKPFTPRDLTRAVRDVLGSGPGP